jgi:hypothetical protein
VANLCDLTKLIRIFNLALDRHATIAVNIVCEDTVGNPWPYHYSAQELEYAYFVHSFYMIGRLLWYQSGRDFFPIQLPGKSGNGERTSSLNDIFLRNVYNVCLVLRV